jgi:peptidoglycan/LPS O-acetylase OafA/YrhL
MRAVAVLLVVAFHAGFPLVQGGFVGVDVFFVISGFLITGLLVSELARTERISITGFYARRIRRLLPLSTVVLVAVAMMTVLVLPALDRPSIGADVRASALWYANIHFAASSTDYMSAVDQSPVLHYWSLSVEEQFYVLWPLLIILVAGSVAVGVGRERLRHNRLVMALGVLFVVSLALSVLTSATSGPWAYFGLHTRAWELAAGGLLALTIEKVRRIPRLTAVLGGYAGLALVIGSAIVFSRSTTFPGTAALVPVGGAVLLLAAGSRTQAGAPRFLSGPAMTYVGRISYGWYLWHWPALVFAKAIWSSSSDDPDLVAAGVATHDVGPWPVVGAVVVSFMLASLTHRLVEDPVRRSTRLAASRATTLAFGAGLLVVAVAVPSYLLGPSSPFAAMPSLVSDRTTSAPAQQPLTPVTLTMTPEQARTDDTTPPNCFLALRLQDSKVDPTCRFGKAGGPVVALIGDSHAAAWFPAFQKVAQERGWQLLFWTKAACGMADVPLWSTGLAREYTECAQWRESVLRQLESEPRLDAVVVGRAFSYTTSVMDSSGARPGGQAAADVWGPGAGRLFTRLAAITPEVLVLRDVPRPPSPVPACLSDHLADPAACAFPRAGHVGLDGLIYDQETRHLPPGDVVHFVDLTDAVCTGDPCPVVSPAGTIVFRDLHHLTATFAREIAPEVARAVVPLIERRR